MTVNEIYRDTIKPLSAADRLRLATIILEDLPARAMVDYREEWSDEDLGDFTSSTWTNAPSMKE